MMQKNTKFCYPVAQVLGENPEPNKCMLRCCLQNVEYNPTVKVTNKSSEIVHLTLSGYTVRSSFSHKHLQRRGVCIFVCKDLNINKIDISHTSREKYLEICAVEQEIAASKRIVKYK